MPTTLDSSSPISVIDDDINQNHQQQPNSASKNYRRRESRRRSTISACCWKLEDERPFTFYTTAVFCMFIIGYGLGHIIIMNSNDNNSLVNHKMSISSSSSSSPTATPKEETAQQQKIDFSTLCQPRHIHISVGTNNNEGIQHSSSMIISFSFLPICTREYMDMVGAIHIRENDTTEDIADDQSPSSSSRFVIGNIDEAQSYNASYTQHVLKHAKNGETYYTSDVYYHIEVRDLKPATRYYYECMLLIHQDFVPQGHNEREGVKENNDGIISTSEQSTFMTPPPPGEWYATPLDKTIKFAVIGDLGLFPHSRETIKSLEQSHCNNNDKTESSSPLQEFVIDSEATQFWTEEQKKFHCHHSQGVDVILLAGDIAYAANNHAVWDDWFDMMSDHSFFRSIPMQIALGNHDLDHVETLEIALAYENRFRMPRVKPPIRKLASNDLFLPKEYDQAKDFVPYDWGNAYYAYSFGPSKHIVLSSYTNFRPGSQQYLWLLSELEAVDRKVTPWLIVMLHCPLYNTFNNHRGEIFLDEAKIYLEPLFVQHTVNFVIAGHLHSYMRTGPTINEQYHPRGPIHIIQGNGGRQANEPYFNPLAEEWVHVRDHSMYGYGTLELFNTTHANWKWIKTGFNAEQQGGVKTKNEPNGRFEPDFELTDEAWIVNQFHLDDNGELMSQ